MRKMNISAPMTYKDRHGADKTKWVNLGNLVIADDGKVFGELNAIPVDKWDGSFSCFDREVHNSGTQQNNVPQQHNTGANAPIYDQNGNQIGGYQQ